MKRLAVNLWLAVLIVVLFCVGAAIADRNFPIELAQQMDDMFRWGYANLPDVWRDFKRGLSDIRLPHILD